MLGNLAISESMFSQRSWIISHVMPVSDGLTAPGRPVYTLQYLDPRSLKSFLTPGW